MRRADTLIIGAGPAGASAAITLAREGIRPILLEASREPADAICGGFLSWQTLTRLERLGLDVDVLSGAPITHMRFFAGTRTAEVALPQQAMGLSRRRLDALLVEKAKGAGAGLERGVSVRSVKGSHNVTLADGTQIVAGALFAATGKHDLRGLGRPRDENATLGLRVRLPARPQLARMVGAAIELHLFEGGYAGLILQEDGTANLCMAVRKSRLAESDGNVARLFESLSRQCHALGERLSLVEALPRADAIAAVPYGWIAQSGEAGCFRLGDQAACIPSLAGEGIGLALESGMMAARAMAQGGPDASLRYQPDFARKVARPVRMAGMLWHAAEHPLRAGMLVGLANLSPGLAGLAARLTRLPD